MNNSLSEYINQINKIPRLTTEQEKCLFKKIKEKGDKNAIKKIAKNYLMLSVKIALNYSKRYPNIILEASDLIHEGYEGLLIAAQKFDYKKCPIFPPYAVYWVRQKITQALYNHSRTIRVSISGTNKSNLYKKIKNEAAQTEKKISLEEIAEKTGTSAKKLKKTLKLIRETITVSMSAPIKGAKDRWNTGLIDNFVSDKKIPNPEETLQIRQMRKKARKMLLILTPREEKVLRMLFGVGEKEEHTLEEIGRLLGGLTKERIRQIEASSLHKLRKKFTVKGNKQTFNFKDYL